MCYPSIRRLQPPVQAIAVVAPTWKKPFDSFIARAGPHEASGSTELHFRAKSAHLKTKRPADGGGGPPTVKSTSKAALPGTAHRTAQRHGEPSSAPRDRAEPSRAAQRRGEPPRGTQRRGKPTKELSTHAAGNPDSRRPRGADTVTVVTRPVPKVPDLPLSARLADLDPAALMISLRARRHPPPRRDEVSQPAEPSNGRAEHISAALMLEVCNELRTRFLLQPRYSPSQLVDLIELMASHCRGLDGAAEAAGLLLVRGCRLALSAAARYPTQDELAKQLPRLVPALAALGYADKGVWEQLFRIMQSRVVQYSGEEVAALVPALVGLDAVMEAAAAGGSGSGSSTDSGGTSMGFGSHQLRQPAMQQRLQALSQDPGISGDATAGLLLWLVVSGLKQLELDQVAALIRRALQAPDLSPQGHCQLLQATARACDRWPQQATEVVNMLQRSPPDLVKLMADKAAQLAAAGELGAEQLTDVAQSLTKLRFLQPDFVTALAVSVDRGIRTRAVCNRDISVALYTCALFAQPQPAVSELYVTAAADLAPRLRDLTSVSLARVAWSYAVAGCCGLLPDGPQGERVRSFLQALCGVLQSRVSEVGPSSDSQLSGQLRYALQIWSATRPSLAPRGLLEAVNLREPHALGKKPHRDQERERQPLQQEGQRQGQQQSKKARSSSSSSEPASLASSSSSSSSSAAGMDGPRSGTRGGGAAAAVAEEKRPPDPTGRAGAAESRPTGPLLANSSNSRGGSEGIRDGGGSGSSGGDDGSAVSRTPRISELQLDVFRQLSRLDYKAKLEEPVGFWTVDICFLARGRKVAVEVDGPWHFTTSEPRRLMGPSLARNACLRALGLAVVPLDFMDYERWPLARRGAELRALVEAAVGAPGNAGV